MSHLTLTYTAEDTEVPDLTYPAEDEELPPTTYTDEDAKFLDFVASVPYQVYFENSAQLKLIVNAVSLRDLIKPIRSISVGFHTVPLSDEDLGNITTILSHAPNLFSLRIYNFGSAAAFGPRFGELLHPDLKLLSTINVDHFCLAQYLRNNPGVDHFLFSGEACSSHNPSTRACPLREIKFSGPVRLHGSVSCVSTMLSRNVVHGLGLGLNSSRDLRSSPRRLLSRISPATHPLTFLVLELQARDSDVLEMVGNTRNLGKLELLKLTVMKEHSGRTSPRKSVGSPKKRAAALRSLGKLKKFVYRTDQQDFIPEARNKDQEWAWIFGWLGAEGERHTSLKQVKLRYQGAVDGETHEIESKWKVGASGWERLYCRSSKISGWA